MKPLHTKQDVIDLAAEHAPTRACQRYMDEQGHMEVFRGVTSPEGWPGWVVRVESIPYRPKGNRDMSWYIGVWVDEVARAFRITYLDRLPEGAIRLEGNRL